MDGYAVGQPNALVRCKLIDTAGVASVSLSWNSPMEPDGTQFVICC